MDLFDELSYCLKPINDQSNLDRISEQELTPKSQYPDPYEVAIEQAEIILRTTDSAVTAIEVVKRLAELEKARQPLPF